MWSRSGPLFKASSDMDIIYDEALSPISANGSLVADCLFVRECIQLDRPWIAKRAWFFSRPVLLQFWIWDQIRNPRENPEIHSSIKIFKIFANMAVWRLEVENTVKIRNQSLQAYFYGLKAWAAALRRNTKTRALLRKNTYVIRRPPRNIITMIRVTRRDFFARKPLNRRHYVSCRTRLKSFV